MPSKRSNDCTVLTGGLIVEYGNYSERNDTYSASTFLKDGRYCMSIGTTNPVSYPSVVELYEKAHGLFEFNS
jgi:hypothetical protein